MNGLIIVIFVVNLYYVFGNISMNDEKETRRVQTIVDLIKLNLKTNGWDNIMCIGTFPKSFYEEIKEIDFTFVTIDINKEEQDIENVVPYHSNVIIISCSDLQELQTIILNIMNNPYFHPLANIILYYHSSPNTDDIAKIMYILWYHKAANAIIVTYNDEDEYLKAFYYNPYVDERSKMPNKYGCWSTKKSGTRNNNNFKDNFICVKGCHNITVTSEIRAFYLGTCMGLNHHKIKYGDTKLLTEINLFKDKCKNLNGFVLRAIVFELLPFMKVEERNGSYTVHNRDGMIWNTMAELMNFTLDFSAVKDLIKKPFKFDVNVHYVYDFTKRYADLLLLPVYQFDVIIVEVDYTVPFTDSGVCIVSHKADYQTVLFNQKLITNNYEDIIRFFVCFYLLWMTFLFYNTIEKKRFTFNQLGNDFLNTIRSVLSISLHRPPRNQSFRIVIAVSTWGYFFLNFMLQASIISLFTAQKRGKEVDTFEDVIQKGYYLEGLASPDVLLPSTEERFEIINNRIFPVPTMFLCIDKMINDSRRFCLNDCAQARFYARNKLDDNGQQYLHVATQDRMHSHYLNMFLHKQSPMTDNYNIYMQRLIEAGLIKKWEDYRFNDIKETTPIKALSMNELASIFELFLFMYFICCVIFIIEICIGRFRYIINFIGKWNRRLVLR